MPIGRSSRSLPDQVAEHLLEAIVAGRLPAGTRLKEVALAQEHAVSRATIREALITLERRRFVERVPRFGARVTKLGADDVAELFEVRAALLAIAAERCASGGDATVLARLLRLVEEMRGQGRADADPQRFAALSIEAQHLLLGASGNRYLLELYEQLASLSTWRLIRTRALSFVQVARRRESARDWGSVAAALSGAGRAGGGTGGTAGAGAFVARGAGGAGRDAGRVDGYATWALAMVSWVSRPTGQPVGRLARNTAPDSAKRWPL